MFEYFTPVTNFPVFYGPKLQDYLPLNLYNSKTTCDRRKQILDLESTSKNTLAG